MNRWSHHVLRAPDDGGAAGAPAAAVPAAAPAPADAPAAAPAAAAPSPASALGAGASAPSPAPAPTAAAAAADPVWGRIPEKFRVKNEDGTPNMAASWDKVEDHRGHLEKRLGAGDIPPAAATDYKVNLPEKFAEAIKADELAASDRFKDFTAAAHAAGLSQKQYDAMVGKMLEYSASLQQGNAALNAEQAVADLRAGWKTDDEFKQQTRAAYQAAQTFAAPIVGDMDKVMAKYGNDPDFIRIMASIGAELREDTAARPSGTLSDETQIESLAKSPAYFNPNDPEHAAVKARVTAFYEKKYGTGAKQSGSLSIGQV